MSDSYPVARFLAKRGALLASMVTLALWFIAVWAVLDGAPLWAGATFLGGGAVAYVLLRSYGELVRILLDILLPE